MSWNLIAEAVVAQLLVPALLAVIGALGAWLLTKLPGPLRAWLDSGTHQRDMGLLLGALARQGLVLATEVAAGRMTRDAAATAAMNYALHNVGGTVAKLGPSMEAFETMARAAVTEALAKVAPALPDDAERTLTDLARRVAQ